MLQVETAWTRYLVDVMNILYIKTDRKKYAGARANTVVLIRIKCIRNWNGSN